MGLDPSQLEYLKKTAGLDEVHTLVATLRTFQTGDFGGSRPITIQVWDSGAGPARYSVRALDEDGNLLAFGNPGDTVHAAIRAVHWVDLDKPPRDR